MPNPKAILWALSLLAGSEQGDPRPRLVESQVAGDIRAALAQAEGFTADHPETARALWVGYLEGDLLERLGRLREANNAFGRLMAESSEVAAYGRYRMASVQETLGHPEVAAGLVATLLGQGAPDDLVGPATELLIRSLRRGADCRLLGRLGAWRLPARQRRELDLAAAECAVRDGERERAAGMLVDLLRRETSDLVARRAAGLLPRLDTAATDDPEVQIAIGLAFHHNREFDLAVERLEAGLAALDPERLVIAPQVVAEHRYATARAYFWLREYATAAQLFRELAATADRPELAARALYQEARCHELSGSWTDAAASFRRAFLADRVGEWSAPALFSALRLEFRGGREAEALELFAVLDTRPGWADMARRAALFLSASDIERGRRDRAGRWLRRTPGKEAVEEFLYWSARLAELEASPQVAIRNYVEILKRDPHHPLAAAARERLFAQPALEPLLEPLAQQLAATGRLDDLHAAWLLLGDDSAAGRAARQSLVAALRADPRSRTFLELEPVPPERWPLWRSPMTRAGERFLALGLWREGEAYVARHFPFSDPPLALAAGIQLDRAGLPRRALYVAEVLADAIPDRLPTTLLPTSFRRQLFPLPYRSAIERLAAQQGVDSHLLAALIREESRFDAGAVSAVSARGLTQFVYPTALEVAATLGLELDDPTQLHRPEIAITLGSRHLARLLEQFDGRSEIAVSAYNAGADQARLWRSYCYSSRPAEFYSKVGFPQTRIYVRKVLSSRSQYAELYGPDSRAAQALRTP